MTPRASATPKPSGKIPAQKPKPLLRLPTRPRFGPDKDGQDASRKYDKQISNGVKDFYGDYWPKDMTQITGYDDNGNIIRPKELPPIAPYLRGGLSADRIPAAEQQIRAGIRRQTPLVDAMASHILAQLKKNRDIMKEFRERQEREARQKEWREARLSPAVQRERQGRFSLLTGSRKRGSVIQRALHK